MDLTVFAWNMTAPHGNGGAVFLRGLCHALGRLGVNVTFVHQAETDPAESVVDPGVRVVQYSNLSDLSERLDECEPSDAVLKFAGCGDYDCALETGILERRSAAQPTVLVDGDAPDNLLELSRNRSHFRRKTIPHFDAVFVCNGGARACAEYERLGARRTAVLSPAADPDLHRPSPARGDLLCDLLFMGNRHPERDARVDELFLKTAAACPGSRFALAGAGWGDWPLPGNVKYLGYVDPALHSRAYSSARFVLNVTRDTMRRYGFCPSSRLFEAAASAACIISDPWPGLGTLLEVGAQVLIANSHHDVGAYLDNCDRQQARSIGRAARRRVLAEHTYDIRARELLCLIASLAAVPREAAPHESDPVV